MSQPDALTILDRREASDERAIPNWWEFPTVEDWQAYMDVHYPIDTGDHARAMARMRRNISARDAALDSLADCAYYARMVQRAAGLL